MYCYGIIYTLCTETKHTTTVNLRDKYPDALYDRVTAHWTAGYRAGAVETTTNVTTIQQYHVRPLVHANHAFRSHVTVFNYR